MTKGRKHSRDNECDESCCRHNNLLSGNPADTSVLVAIVPKGQAPLLRFGVWCNGFAEKASHGGEDWFKGEIAKRNSQKPFFFVQHSHPRDTVYGVNAWGKDDGAATLGGTIAEYEISAEGLDGAHFETRTCAIGGLYPRSSPKFGKPESAVIALDRLPVGAKTVRVTPLDSFGNRGRPLESAIDLAPL